MRIEDIQTPALLLDRARLTANAARMRTRAEALGVRLRPHLKTAKSHEVARCAHGGHYGPITVSTLREAEYFAAHGWRDMLYAVCIVPQKLGRIARLTARGVRVTVIVDSVEAAQAVANHSGQHTVLIEVDSGEHRTGCAPDSARLLDIADILHAGPRCSLLGVLTHGGHSYGAADIEAIVGVAEQERAAAVTAAARIRAHGVACDVVSVGSTPTAVHARHLEGVTDMRPGVYLFGDVFQVGQGSCRDQDMACSVLASVISQQRQANRLVVDAGGLALSKDRSTAGTDFDAGYGRVADAVTGTILPHMHVASVHQEHGEIVGREPIEWARFPIGSLVRIYPNHICMTAAMYDRYHVLGESGETIEDCWPRTNGWHPLPHRPSQPHNQTQTQPLDKP